MLSGRSLAVAFVVSLVTLVLPGQASAQEPAPTTSEITPTDSTRPWESHPLGFGAHLGLALGGGNVGSRRPLSNRLGVAPTLVAELTYRLTDHVSIGGLFGGGLGTATPSPCPESVEGFQCKAANLVLFGGFLRYHFAPTGKLEPWLGVGLGLSGLIETAERSTVQAASAPCGAGCSAGYSTDRTTTRLGVEGIFGGGASFRIAPTMSFGFAIQGFAGQYVTGTTKAKYSAGAEESRPVSVSDSNHVIVLTTLHLVFHLQP